MRLYYNLQFLSIFSLHLDITVTIFKIPYPQLNKCSNLYELKSNFYLMLLYLGEKQTGSIPPRCPMPSTREVFLLNCQAQLMLKVGVGGVGGGGLSGGPGLITRH